MKLKLEESVDAKDAWLKQVKHHRRRLKGLPRVGFNPNAGNVEHNISMLNMMLGSGGMLSNNPISGPFGGDVASGASMGESFNNKINNRGFIMSDEIRQYVLELVLAEFETGHILSEDYRTFKKLVSDDGYRATKTMYDFYLECRELGPAGFYAEYKNELNFDPDFVLGYRGEDTVIEESLTEMTNMEKLRNMYPELAESYDKDGDHEKCEECGALLNDAGECPRCVHGDEEVLEQINEATLNEGPFDRLNKKMDKADRKINSKVDKLAAPKNVGKILYSTYKDQGNTYLIDGEWQTSKDVLPSLRQAIQSLASLDASLTVTTEDKLDPDLIKFIDAVVKDKDGYIIRRGLELIKPRTLPFNPTRMDLIKIKDGFRAEDIVGIRAQRNSKGNQETNNDRNNSEAQNQPTEEPKTNTQTNSKPADNSQNNQAVNTPAEQKAPEETKTAEAPEGVTDKTIQNTINAAKVFGMNIYTMQSGSVEEMNDAQLKRLTTKTDMEKIWVGKDKNSRVTLSQLADELKKRNIVESLDDEMEYDNLEEKVITYDALHDGDMEELLSLAKEIGINTMGELEDFAEREMPHDLSLLDTLRRYRDDLGDDFELREEVLYPMIETKDVDDDMDEDSLTWK